VLSLIYCTKPKTKKWQTELKSKNKYAQNYGQTVPGISGVSLEEEKIGYGGKDLQKGGGVKPGMKE